MRRTLPKHRPSGPQSSHKNERVSSVRHENGCACASNHLCMGECPRACVCLPQQVYWQWIKPIDACTVDDGFFVGHMLMDISAKTESELARAIKDFVARTEMLRDSFVHLGSLVSGFLAQVIYHESLKCLGSIGLNLFLHYLDEITVNFVLQSARTKASAARESIFIDSRTITFEAWKSLFIRNLLLFLPNNLASYLLRNGFSPELASFTLCLDEAIA